MTENHWEQYQFRTRLHERAEAAKAELLDFLIEKIYDAEEWKKIKEREEILLNQGNSIVGGLNVILPVKKVLVRSFIMNEHIESGNPEEKKYSAGIRISIKEVE